MPLRTYMLPPPVGAPKPARPTVYDTPTLNFACDRMLASEPLECQIMAALPLTKSFGMLAHCRIPLGRTLSFAERSTKSWSASTTFGESNVTLFAAVNTFVPLPIANGWNSQYGMPSDEISRPHVVPGLVSLRASSTICWYVVGPVVASIPAAANMSLL